MSTEVAALATSSRIASFFSCALLALLACFIIGYGLGANSLHNGDEAKHTLIAQELVTSGSWLTLTYQGEPYFLKPPLKFWLTALTFKLLGSSELTARLGSAVFAIATILLLCLMGGRLGHGFAGFLSAVILAGFFLAGVGWRGGIRKPVQKRLSGLAGRRLGPSSV